VLADRADGGLQLLLHVAQTVVVHDCLAHAIGALKTGLETHVTRHSTCLCLPTSAPP
jgi:hypothetical protein